MARLEYAPRSRRLMKMYATHTTLAPRMNRSPIIPACPSSLPPVSTSATPTREITAPAVCAGRRRVRSTAACTSMVRMGIAARISDALTVEVR